MTDSGTRPVPSLRDLGYLTDDELAELRGVERTSLRNERSKGRGPAFTRMGRQIVYPIDGVRAWLAANTTKPDHAPTLVNAAGRRGRAA
jgi:hypothetical protein